MDSLRVSFPSSTIRTLGLKLFTWHTRVFMGRESTVCRFIPSRVAYWHECSGESFEPSFEFIH
jgi:hypothetical protein